MVGKRSIHSRAYTRKNKKKTKLYVVIAVCILIVCIGISWWVTNRSPLVLTGVDVVGTERTSREDVRMIADRIRMSNILLWSRNNFLLVPRSDIESTLRSELAWVTRAHVEVKGVSRLYVVIEEHVPAYMYCDQENTEQCFFVDAEGLIFAQGLKSRQKLVTFYGNKEGDSVGTFVTLRQNFEKIVSFIQGLSDNALSVEKVVLEDQGETHIVLENGTYIIIDIRENTEDMLGNFLLLLTEETVRNETREAFLSQTEYIDVRYGNKVFYKAKE